MYRLGLFLGLIFSVSAPGFAQDSFAEDSFTKKLDRQLEKAHDNATKLDEKLRLRESSKPEVAEAEPIPYEVPDKPAEPDQESYSLGTEPLYLGNEDDIARVRWFPVEGAESYLLYSLDEAGQAVKVEEAGCSQSSGLLQGICIAETQLQDEVSDLKVSAIFENGEESPKSASPQLRH